MSPPLMLATRPTTTTLLPGLPRRVDLSAPPRWAFAARRYPGPQPLVLTADGLLFGHIALWRSCHVGYPGTCMRPPRSRTGYAFFHLGVTATDDGGLLDVGKFTVGIGHAPLTATTWQAIDHYDNAALSAAVVRAYEDSHGIQLAGVRTPDCSDARWAMARRSPGSGDWRRIEGNLEMIACLGVNSPGFPIPRQANRADGMLAAVQAAGALPHWTHWVASAVADALAQGLSADAALAALLTKGHR